MNQIEHLTAGDIASYLDHDLAQGARERVERHLDACADCRSELSTSARLVDSWVPAAPTRSRARGRRPRRLVLLAAGGTLAAAAAALVVISSRLPVSSYRSEPVRAPDFGEGRARLEIISPSPDSIVETNPVELAWHSSVATLYRVTVLTESADPLYTADTRDTTIVLPDSLNLGPGRTYFWRVEGIANGIVSTTGATRLRVQR